MSLKGTVKAWIEVRGMGFITDAESGGADEDFFVHRSALMDCTYLIPGTEVTFEPDFDSQKDKKIAQNVSSPDAAAASGGGGGAAIGGAHRPGGETGVVKAWLEHKGMGFITPDDGGEERFVHRSMLLGALQLSVGLAVSFTPDFDAQKGKSIAKDVVVLQNGMAAGPPVGKGHVIGGKGYDYGKGSGYDPMGKGAWGKGGGYGKAPSPPALANRAGPYGPPSTSLLPGYEAGVVKAWKEERGMGFIVPNRGGEDMFVHRSQILNAQGLVEGSPVTYEPAFDPMKGKAIANNVTVLGAGGGGGYGSPSHTMAAVVPPPAWPQQYSAVPAVASRPMQSAATGGTVSGTVKSWIEERGMGFVTPNDGGEDHFVHRSFLLGGIEVLPLGAPVTFEPHWDMQKNKAIAKNVALGGAASHNAFPPQYAAPRPSAFPYADGVLAQQPPQHIEALGMRTGVVKAWREDRGMGFITPDGGEEDLFVHRSWLANVQALSVGVRVMFVPEWDPMKGKPIAKNVTTGGPDQI